MRDIGGIVWILIVVIGVVSSIVNSARRAAAQRQAQPVRPQAATPPTAVAPGIPRRIDVVRATVSPAQAQQAPVPKPQPAPVAAPPPVPPAPRVAASPAPRKPIVDQKAGVPLAALFADRSSLVNAVIAAEVLGKPHALRDEYFWG
ncbi:MAG: hypothetical protein JO199_13370 [Candidatus Eremiobacteraeota bacterium]|nr:hypothetical protein [Candidatus Eremiobacteraeota bacterium]